MKAIKLSLLAGSALLLGACATAVKPTYVSPTQYQALNCQQLQSEYSRIQQSILIAACSRRSAPAWALASAWAGAGAAAAAGASARPFQSTWASHPIPKRLNWRA